MSEEKNLLNKMVKNHRKYNTPECKTLMRLQEKKTNEVFNQEYNDHLYDWAANLDRYTQLGRMWNKVKHMKGTTTTPLDPKPKEKAEELIIQLSKWR